LAVEASPLEGLLDLLQEYAGLRGDWRRRKLVGAFTKWGASPCWWRGEPCPAGRSCRECAGAEALDYIDNARELAAFRDWDDPPEKPEEWTYSGCGPLYGLKEVAYAFRSPREASLVLKALSEVVPQKYCERRGEVLPPSKRERLKADLAAGC
jgi:hypothetical protein